MQAVDRPFTQIINGTSQFIIPVFQRDYSWTEENCDQLWKDIARIGLDISNRRHFLGSMVYISTGDSSAGFTRWLLIDGQQRLTTLTLLLLAMRDHIKSTRWAGLDEGPSSAKIDAYFLKNLHERGERIHKLVLRRHDQETLKALLDCTEPPANNSKHVTDNYEFFREKLLGCDLETIYRGIGRLVVVDVTLDRLADDPQLIFESLNSTGMDLSQSDLIRNFILMRLAEGEQTRLYESYWSKLEFLFRGSERIFDAFIRDYIALRTQASKQEKSDEIYFAFRREFEAIGSDPLQMEVVLEDLLRFAKFHAAFSLGVGGPVEVREPLARLRRLVDVPAILVMRLFEINDKFSTFNINEFSEAIVLLESYVFRRAICGEQTRGYWQVFANLAYRINDEKPLESLKVGLARFSESYCFPDNEKFRQALEERDIYNKRVCFDLLDRLENYENREPSDTSTFTIEHIMPQNEMLCPEWTQMIGNNWQETQREWVHRLGNLTLTGYNSTYSDRPFSEKKNIPGGFSDSSVRLNRYIREQDVWTPTEMKMRGEELSSRALIIWPNLIVEKGLIDQARDAEMRERSRRRDVSNVPMSEAARQIFNVLREQIFTIDADIIELAETKSISYHGPLFFMEVLPRKREVGLLLAQDFNEIEDGSGFAKDASQWKFIVNAEHEGGVYLSIESESDIEKAMPMIRLARELSRT